MKIIRTDAKNQDFITLTKLLDKELASRDGDAHAFYDQFNKIVHLSHVVVLYENNIPLGCGAIKKFNMQSTEIKRMYVIKTQRGKGLASILLKELETWSKELKYSTCVLETGKKQYEAIGLYTKNGYQKTPNYGQYIGKENSLCFEKKL